MTKLENKPVACKPALENKPPLEKRPLPCKQALKTPQFVKPAEEHSRESGQVRIWHAARWRR